MLRKLSGFWLVAVAATLGGLIAQASPAAAAPAVHAAPAATKVTGFQGSAYGTLVKVGGVVKSGRSALSVLGCTSQTGVTNTNSVASFGLPGVLVTGTIATSTASQDTSPGIASTSTATTNSLDVLGMVQATAVQSVASATRRSGVYGTSSAGTVFTDLSVAGEPVSETPPANTKMSLPGVGYVILNQQTAHTSADGSSLTVIGIHVYVTVAGAPVPVGTQIEVSAANASLTGALSGLLSGRSYGANANAVNSVIAGPAFPEYLSCVGTNGATRTNTGASVSIPGVLTSGTVTDTVEGNAKSKSPSAEVTSAVEDVNLLGGMVTAKAVKADVTAAGRPPALGDKSGFAGLTVSGYPSIGDNVPPNTKEPLQGFGTLWLHRVLKSRDSITVIMVQLIVTVPSNPAGLQPGTKVNIGYATVDIK